MIEYTERNARIIDYDYDNLHRLVGETWTEGQTIVNELLLTHDGVNQLLSAIDGFSDEEFEYDLLGRVTQETWDNPGAPTVELNKAYDANSNRTELSARIDHGSGFVNDLKNVYTLDDLNRMTRVDQTANGGNAVAEKRGGWHCHSGATGVSPVRSAPAR